MAKKEEVLVIERKVFEQAGQFNGLNFDVQKYIEHIFKLGVPEFMDREQAEKNPDYKQLIPYVIINHGSEYLTYVRGKRAGETRLVGNRSIGIGGHINPVDDLPLIRNIRKDFYETYLSAVQREVDEEIDVQSDYNDKIVALLNDESNEVGSVHLGVVHFWQLNEKKVQKKEQMITQMEFMAIDELRKAADSMETWSSICVEQLEKMR